MRLNGLQCDNCAKQHLIDPTLLIQNLLDVLPEGWFIVTRGPYNHNIPRQQQEPLLFCSNSCLYQYASKLPKGS